MAAFTTASVASWSMRMPKLLQPRPTSLTFSPLLPRLRYSIAKISPSKIASIQRRPGHGRRPRWNVLAAVPVKVGRGCGGPPGGLGSPPKPGRRPMETIDIKRDVVFADAGDRPLKLDLYRPTEGGLGAAVVLFHGGGWSRGDKSMLAPHASALASQGFVAVVPEYRLTGEALWPAQIHDVKRAIRWTRSHAAELGFDPERLCLEGHSAGAHLVLLAAGTPDDPRLDPPKGNGGVSAAAAAVAAIYPPVLFHLGGTRPSGGLSAKSLPGADVSEAAAALASPI